MKGDVTVKSVRFDITKSAHSTDSPLDYEVKYPNKYSDKLNANQNNFIHIEFKTNSDAPAILFAGVRLVHPKYTDATGTVIFKQNKDSNVFNAVVDLGDPDHVLPYEDTYDLQISVSSEFVTEPIVWTVAKLQLSFISPATKPPTKDYSTVLLPEIQHTFPEDRKKPSTVITTVFSAAIGALLLVFIVFVGKLNVNLNKIPSSFIGSISTLGFLAAIIGLVGILVLFWLKIDLFETLTLFGIVVIPTIIVGGKALDSLKSE